MSDSLHSYFLAQSDDSWRWRVIDEEGEVVASGAASDQRAADASALEVVQLLETRSLRGA